MYIGIQGSFGTYRDHFKKSRALSMKYTVCRSQMEFSKQRQVLCDKSSQFWCVTKSMWLGWVTNESRMSHEWVWPQQRRRGWRSGMPKNESRMSHEWVTNESRMSHEWVTNESRMPKNASRMSHKSTPITLNESRTSHECVTNEPRMNLECVCVTNESQILSIFIYYEKQDSVVGVRGSFDGTQG